MDSFLLLFFFLDRMVGYSHVIIYDNTAAHRFQDYYILTVVAAEWFDRRPAYTDISFTYWLSLCELNMNHQLIHFMRTLTLV